MATQLFLGNSQAVDTHPGSNSPPLISGSAATGWSCRTLQLTRGSALQTGSQNTVTGPTTGVEIGSSAGSTPFAFISPPVSADVTISGTITANIWASENNMSANVAINVRICILRANSFDASGCNSLVEIVKSTRNTEEAVTTRAVANFTTGMTSGGYTSQTLNRGDRLFITVFGDDVSGANMATGFTFNFGFGGSSASVDGDSYVTFTETITFESAPTGSVLYLTDTASVVSTSSVDREAWTSRGAGVQTDVTNTAAGWTSPIQVTDTAGGTAVDWFTRPLNAFTLGGMAVANIRALQSATSANASLRVEIARVEGDGTSPTVWASWCIATQTGPDHGELSTSEVARTANVSGDDLAITDGQRLRIRLYIDDMSLTAMGASQTVTTYYAGTSGGASGDTYITFPQTLTEYVSSTPGPVWKRKRPHRFLTLR